MASENEKNKTRIDLGLGAILAGVPAASVTEKCVDLLSDTPSSWTLGEAPPPAPQTEYEILADQRAWRDVVRRAESSLSKEGGDAEARAWWIRGHLGGFSMPVSLLAAPMESLLQSVELSGLSDSVRRVIEESAVLTVRRLEEVGESEQSQRLRATMGPLNIAVDKDSSGRPRRVTSSFRAADFVEEPQSAPPKAPAPNVVVGVPSPRKRVALGALLATLLLITLDYCVQSDWFFAPVSIASESFVQDSSSAEQSVVALEPKDPVGRLGALFYAMDEAGDKPNSQDDLSDLSADRQPIQSPQRGQGEQPAARDASSENPRSKERVNTKGPVESPDFSERVERRRERYSVERAPLEGGSPRAVLPHREPAAPTDAGRIFRVLARTDVVSAPSFGGRVIGALETGDKVLVEGFLGRWVRLRSRHGRGGYVLAHDVEEVNPDRGEVGELPQR